MIGARSRRCRYTRRPERADYAALLEQPVTPFGGSRWALEVAVNGLLDHGDVMFQQEVDVDLNIWLVFGLSLGSASEHSGGPSHSDNTQRRPWREIQASCDRRLISVS
jgi:hypothetical protein